MNDKKCISCGSTETKMCDCGKTELNQNHLILKAMWENESVSSL